MFLKILWEAIARFPRGFRPAQQVFLLCCGFNQQTINHYCLSTSWSVSFFRRTTISRKIISPVCSNAQEQNYLHVHLPWIRQTRHSTAGVLYFACWAKHCKSCLNASNEPTYFQANIIRRFCVVCHASAEGKLSHVRHFRDQLPHRRHNGVCRKTRWRNEIYLNVKLLVICDLTQLKPGLCRRKSNFRLRLWLQKNETLTLKTCTNVFYCFSQNAALIGVNRRKLLQSNSGFYFFLWQRDEHRLGFTDEKASYLITPWSFPTKVKLKSAVVQLRSKTLFKNRLLILQYAVGWRMRRREKGVLIEKFSCFKSLEDLLFP